MYRRYTRTYADMHQPALSLSRTLSQHLARTGKSGERKKEREREREGREKRRRRDREKEKSNTQTLAKLRPSLTSGYIARVNELAAADDQGL